MRIMNGRLHNIIRSPLIKSNFMSQYDKSGHRNHHHHHHNQQTVLNDEDRRRRSSENYLPKSVQFDESADDYRCLCSCFHVKTGAFVIAGIELFLILFYFINALLILLQQQQGYTHSQKRDGSGTSTNDGSDYVIIAFIITCIALTIALSTTLLMIVGLTRNMAALLISHIFVQGISIVCFVALLFGGVMALYTESAFFYRIINVIPFNDYPGQTTVALPIELTVRVYAILGLYFISLLLECWFILIIYNCYRYFTERRTYMKYCLAYSTPMKTLNSAR